MFSAPKRLYLCFIKERTIKLNRMSTDGDDEVIRNVEMKFQELKYI
jgi:hypothetical protein